MEELKYYHLYNRGNNREKLFYTRANYEYFIQRYLKHCFHILETYAYCLMNNHFHFLISVRSKKEQLEIFTDRNLKSKKLQTPSKHLSNFFSSYTQSINNQEGRIGSLFSKNFKRKEIISKEQFRNTLVYIHKNPVNHGFTKALHEYPYSSYHHYLNEDPSFLKREKAFQIFDGIESFIKSHE